MWLISTFHRTDSNLYLGDINLTSTLSVTYEFTHRIIRNSKSEIHRAGQQARDLGSVDVVILRWALTGEPCFLALKVYRVKPAHIIVDNVPSVNYIC